MIRKRVSVLGWSVSPSPRMCCCLASQVMASTPQRNKDDR